MAPAVAPASGSVTVTADSTEDTTKSGTTKIAATNPQPTVASVSPSLLNASTAPVTLTVAGTGFVPGASVSLSDTSLATTFVSTTQLSATLPAASQIGGSYSVTVTNPAPGGGNSSPSSTLTVTPVIVGLAPASGPVGSTLSVTVIGANQAQAESNAVSFAQAGQTVSATATAATTSNSGVVLTIAVPSGLSPSTAAAVFSAPSMVSATVGSIAAANSEPFEVSPIVHGLNVSPQSGEQGATFVAAFQGVSTSFGPGTQLTADDPGLTFSNVSAVSASVVTTNLSVGSSVAPGSHTIAATTGSSAVPFTFTVLAASPVPLVVNSFSSTSFPPLTPFKILGSGLTAGGLAGSSVVLQYDYSTATIQIPVPNPADTEIDTLVPALIDPISGQLYAGSATVQVLVDGRASSATSVTILPLPANTGAIGATTLEYFAQVSSQLNAEQSNLVNITAIPSDQLQAMASVLQALQTQVAKLSAQISNAAAGGTGTALNGATFSQAQIDLLDRFLQAANVVNGTSASAQERRQIIRTGLAQSGVSETTFSVIGSTCLAADFDNNISTVFTYATAAVCLSTLVPGLDAITVPLCAAMGDLQFIQLAIEIVETACDTAPINLSSVGSTPDPLSLPVTDTGGQTESAVGTFTTTRDVVAQGVDTVLDSILIFPGVQNLLATELFGSSGELATDRLSGLQALIDLIVPSVNNGPIQSLTQTVPLTSTTTSFFADPLNLVQSQGLTITPTGIAGSTILQYNLSAFRLLDSSYSLTSSSSNVVGDTLPVQVTSVVTVNPPAFSVGEGEQVTFTATVTGTTNRNVSWSVDQIPGGNSTVGAISSGGIYSAPITVGTHTITATSSFDGSTGSATVTVIVPTVTVTVSPASAQVPVNGLQQFSAAVANTSNTAVTWSANGVPGGNSTVGTISFAGLYTAPAKIPSPATVTVTATSQADSTKSGSATVTIGSYTNQTLYSFTSLSDGAAPSAPLIQAEDGNFYGTTQVGGTYGDGTIFKVDSAGNVTTLHEFDGSDGANPIAPVVQANDGNFYGTTDWGGDYDEGAFFRIDSSGNFESLYSFTGGDDGGDVAGGLIQATDGYLYGTTFHGGTYAGGTVFRMNLSGNITTLYSFTGGTDGYGAEGSLIQASDGYFYGVTQNGGNQSCAAFGGTGCGTVFRMDSDGNLETLYTFAGGLDGAQPEESLIQASDGDFYGTTLFGGDSSCSVSSYTGCGTIFKIDSSGDFTLLHDFTGGPEGGVPFSSLIQAGDGDFYGTAAAGGDPSCSVTASGENYPTYIGCGTVFQMDSAGNVNALYSFKGSPNDGSNPFAAVAEGSDGYLYGTTRWGGAETSCPYTDNGGCGTFFRVAGPGGPLPPVSALKSSSLRILQEVAAPSLPPKPLVKNNPTSRQEGKQQKAAPLAGLRR